MQSPSTSRARPPVERRPHARAIVGDTRNVDARAGHRELAATRSCYFAEAASRGELAGALVDVANKHEVRLDLA
jgi:hypothetical protein